MEFARRAYERAQMLFKERLIAQSALDDAHSAVDMAENRKRAAQSQLAVSEAKVTEARAQVAQAKAAADRDAEDLANATIRAPIRATVLSRDVEIGSPVSSILNLGANATLVMTLGDIDKVFVRGKVDEADIGRVRLRPAGPHSRRDVQGSRVQRPRHADLADGRRERQRHQLRSEGVDRQSGQRAQSQHDGERRDRARRAPERAAHPRGGHHLRRRASRRSSMSSIAGAPNGRRKTAIKLGVGNGTKIEVLDGLKPGDKLLLPG